MTQIFIHKNYHILKKNTVIKMANDFSKNESCPDCHLIIMLWFLISVLQFLCDHYTVHSGHYFVKLSLTNEIKFGAKLNILLKNTKNHVCFVPRYCLTELQIRKI